MDVENRDLFAVQQRNTNYFTEKNKTRSSWNTKCQRKLKMSFKRMKSKSHRETIGVKLLDSRI